MIFRVVLFAVLVPATAAAQAPSRAAIIAAATDIIQKAHYCTFITIGEDGHPHARIVDPLAPGADFTVWFATNPLTRKVEQVRRNPKVTLSCFDAATASYITLLGRATLVTDAAEKQRHWKSDWTAFYPNGAKGSDVVLIRILPEQLEIVSESRGMISDPKTWEPTSIGFIEPRAIDLAKHTGVRELDRSLPDQTLLAWLDSLVGPGVRQTWNATDCGEYPGHPQPGRNFPICAEVEVALSGGRALSISLGVGTERDGLSDRSRDIWWIALTDSNGTSRHLSRLSELPAAIGRSK